MIGEIIKRDSQEKHRTFAIAIGEVPFLWGNRIIT